MGNAVAQPCQKPGHQLAIPKIAHVYYSQLANPGIENKTRAQARAAQELGLNMDFYIIQETQEETHTNFHFVKTQYQTCFSLRFSKEKAFRKPRFIRNSLDLRPFDAIILRYPFLSLECKIFLDRFGPKIITEHHVDEVAEFLAAPDPRRFIWALLEKIAGRKFLSKVGGIIGVTDEIRLLELKKSGNKPSLTVPNGVDVERTSFSGFQPYNGKDLRIIFVASEFANYQGLERLLKGIQLYRGQENISLTLIGKIFPDDLQFIREIRTPKKNIHILGVLPPSELDQHFSQATIAVGSLAFYKKDMQEACTLKVREYCARGIPFIYAYHDSDFPDELSFSKKFPNDSGIILIEDLITFAAKQSRDSHASENMRAFALKNLDWKAKVRGMHEFASQIASSNCLG